MTTYNPDLWVIVELTSAQGVHERVLASWYGSFTTGDSWKLSSGIEGVSLDEDGAYVLPQTSGSTYIVRKGNQGISTFTSSILASLQKAADESNGKLKIRLLTQEETAQYLQDRIKS